MQFVTRSIIIVAMTLLGIVSVWTTYKSLTDSILPEPLVGIPLPNGVLWQCSIFALGLSVAIGLMLFALKMAIIDDQKRLNLLGFVGMSVVASISIAFNMDVLYRTAKKDFYINFAYNQMRTQYDDYLADVQNTLMHRREEILKQVAGQEGELEAEIKGLRQAPAGYGQRARQEDYRLTVVSKTAAIELESIDQALEAKNKANELLAAAAPRNIQGIQDLQNQLRVAVKDAGAIAGKPLPPSVESDSPLFAVFANLFDPKAIGLFEVFILALAFLLDLGDIVGYSLVPSKQGKRTRPYLTPLPDFGSPQVVPPRADLVQASDLPEPKLLDEAASGTPAPPVPVDDSAQAARRRSMSFRRRR